MATVEMSLDRGLPASLDAERSILGAILLDNNAYNQAAESLRADDFSLDSNRRIYSRMSELAETGRPVDIITLSEELHLKKELEAVGGVAYLSSLVDGLPHRPSIEQYVRIVKDKALLRNLINTAQNAISRAYDQAEPAEEIVNATESAIFAIAEQRIQQGFANIPEIVRGSFGSIDKLYESGRKITGLETHYADLDELTSGFQPSDLVIIAARPSMGKTAFAMNIAENVAVRDKKVVAVFSLEMAKEALLMRMLCSQSRVDSHKLRTGFIGREDRQKLVHGLAALSESKMFLDDTPGITLSEMRAKARRLVQQQGRIDLIVIDYLQLITGQVGAGKRYENRTQEVSAISRGLKMMAKELKTPVVALSQLSRAAETREKGGEPKLSDLRESGSIEQDADVVMFIHRPEYYDRDNPDLEGIAKLIIAKQRNGPVDTVQLAFRKSWTGFETLAKEFWIK